MDTLGYIYPVSDRKVLILEVPLIIHTISKKDMTDTHTLTLDEC